MRNVAMVAGGTAVAQAINVAATPVITRLYGPEAFGLLGVFNSLVVALIPLTCLGYEIAIVIPKSGRDARALVRLCSVLAVGVSAILAVAALVGSRRVGELLGLGASSWYLLLVPAALLAAAVAEILSHWLIRVEHFRPLARVTVTQSSLLAGTTVGLGFLWPSAIVLIAASTARQFYRMLRLASLTRRDLRGLWLGRSDAEAPTAAQMARRYRDFPLLDLPRVFAVRVGDAAPTLILAAFFGPAFAGFYELARRIVKLPSSLLAESISQVYRSRAARAVHDGRDFSRDLLRISGSLLLLGLIPYGVMTAFGPALFRVVFGPQWDAAGHVARWLAVWYLVHVAVQPGMQALMVTRHLRFTLGWAVVTNAAKLGALTSVALVTQDPIFAVAVYAVVAIGADIVLIAAAYLRAGTPVPTEGKLQQ